MFLFTGFVIAVFLGNSGPVNAAPAEQYQGELSASLDRNSVQIGEVVQLTLRYRLPEGGSLPRLPAVGGLEGITKLEQTMKPGEIRIALFVDRLDSWQSETLTLSFNDKAGNTQTLKADPVSVTVNSVLGEKPDEAQLRPIRDIIVTKRLWRSYWPWLSGLAGLAMILSCAYLWYRKKRLRNLPAEMMELPHVSARKAIEALEKSRIFEKGETKTFYFTFSEIIRRYLGSIRHFPAAEYTTEEISQRLQMDVDRKLLPLLRQADLVKFAEAVPTTARKEDDVRLALFYIDETGPPADDPANAKPQRATEGGNP
jgi:hypothetical protein